MNDSFTVNSNVQEPYLVFGGKFPFEAPPRLQICERTKSLFDITL